MKGKKEGASEDPVCCRWWEISLGDTHCLHALTPSLLFVWCFHQSGSIFDLCNTMPIHFWGNIIEFYPQNSKAGVALGDSLSSFLIS